MYVFMDDNYLFVEGSVDSVVSEIPPGIYRATCGMKGIRFLPETIRDTVVVDLDHPAYRLVREQVNRFTNPVIRERLAIHELRNVFGCLLYGPVGTGKTSLIRSLLQDMKDVIVLIEPDIDELEHHVIPAIRSGNPHIPIVLVFDEFGRACRGSVSELLKLMDGMSSPNDIMIIGATNDITSIPDAITRRVGRFPYIIKIDQLSMAARMGFLRKRFPAISDDVLTSINDIFPHASVDDITYIVQQYVIGIPLDTLPAHLAATHEKFDTTAQRNAEKTLIGTGVLSFAPSTSSVLDMNDDEDGYDEEDDDEEY